MASRRTLAAGDALTDPQCAHIPLPACTTNTYHSLPIAKVLTRPEIPLPRLPSSLRETSRGWTPEVDPRNATAPQLSQSPIAPRQLSLSELASPSVSQIETKDDGNHSTKKVNPSSESPSFRFDFVARNRFLFCFFCDRHNHYRVPKQLLSY